MHREENLDHLDQYVINSETDTNPSVNTSILNFESQIEVEKLKDLLNGMILIFHIVERLVQRYFRFKSVVVNGKFIETDVNVKNHVKIIHLGNLPDGDESLRRAVSQCCSKPLDYRIPLWEVIVIYHDEHRTCIVWRIHHCIGDGPSLFCIFAQMCDAVKFDVHIPKISLCSWMMHYISLILCLGPVLCKWTRINWKGQPSFSLKTLNLGREKNFAWCSIPLAQSKHIAHELNGKINDLMITLLMGALDRYRLKHDGHGNLTWINVGIPITLRGGVDMKIGNKFGFCVETLPLGIKDPVTRFRKVKKCMDFTKQLKEQFYIYGLSWISNLLCPKWMIRSIGTSLSSRNVTAVLTNVTGHENSINFLGKPITSMPIVRFNFSPSLSHLHMVLVSDVPFSRTMENCKSVFHVIILSFLTLKNFAISSSPSTIS